MGDQVFGTYENGVPAEEFYVDTLDTSGFQNRFVTYDAAGQITARGTVCPEGLRVSESFETGVRTETLLQDGFFGDAAKPWQQIAFAHDAAGNIAERRTTLDDGRVEVETFEKGIRETRLAAVQSKHWVTINGYRDDVLAASAEIDLTFDHVSHALGWEDIDRVDFVPNGGGITDEYVENAGWFSMDDVVFIA